MDDRELNYADELEYLFQAWEASWEYRAGPGEAFPQERHAKIPHPNTEEDFIVGLHELGHIASEYMTPELADCSLFVREGRASAWALEWLADNQPDLFDKAKSMYRAGLDPHFERERMHGTPIEQLLRRIPKSLRLVRNGVEPDMDYAFWAGGPA